MHQSSSKDNCICETVVVPGANCPFMVQPSVACSNLTCHWSLTSASTLFFICQLPLIVGRYSEPLNGFCHLAPLPTFIIFQCTHMSLTTTYALRLDVYCFLGSVYYMYIKSLAHQTEAKLGRISLPIGKIFYAAVCSCEILASEQVHRYLRLGRPYMYITKSQG